MGNCACRQKPRGMSKLTKMATGQGSVDGYATERELMEKTIIPSKNATKSAIVSLDDCSVRVTYPDDFFPPKQCIKDIIEAYDGNLDGLAERGLNFENGVPVNTPAKIYEKRMFGSDAKGGGSVIYKTKQCLLIVIYEGNPAQANRMTAEAGDFLMEQGL